MEKRINIIQNETTGMQSMKVDGFSAWETLGILRFYEKHCWLDMQKQIDEGRKKITAGVTHTAILEAELANRWETTPEELRSAIRKIKPKKKK